MTPQEYRDAIARLGWSQVRAAAELGVKPRASRAWALGENKVPKLVEKTLRALLDGRLDPEEWR